MNRLIAVIGPSGSGKSSLVRELDRRGLVRVHPTWTTRPRRADETRGSLEHRFVTDDVFDALDGDGFFLATGSLFALPWRYGLPHIVPAGDGRLDLVMLRAPVVERVRGVLPLGLVIQVVDDAARVSERLRARASGPHDVAARLSDNELEVARGRQVADVTLLNDGTIAELAERAWDAVLCHGAHLAAAGGCFR
jgi:guanylate kinase